MLRDAGGGSTNFSGAKGGRGQTPASRSAASKGLAPSGRAASKGPTLHGRAAPKRLNREGGWVGMIVLLLALAIVAWLSKDALKQYAFMAPATTNVKTEAASPGERARAPAAVDATGVTIESAAPVPTAPMDRARGVESTLKRQEGQRGGGN
jgi:hypothetical protein